MPHITARQIEAFRAVMLTGSMTGAAELMNITQPAVSRLINDLEAIIDLQLFERHNSFLVATRDAATIADEVDRSFVGLRRIEEFIHAVREQNAGSLRIGALSAFAMEILPHFVSSFTRSRPHVEISLNAYTSPIVYERIASGELDFGFVMTASSRPGFFIRELRGEIVVAMRHDHPLAEKTVIRAHDLEGQTVIGSRRPQFPTQMDIAVATLEKVHWIETDFAHIAAVLASEGAGITLADPFTAGQFATRGLVARKFEPAIECGYALVVSQKRPPTPIAEAFISGFRDHLSGLKKLLPCAHAQP